MAIPVSDHLQRLIQDSRNEDLAKFLIGLGTLFVVNEHGNRMGVGMFREDRSFQFTTYANGTPRSITTPEGIALIDGLPAVPLARNGTYHYPPFNVSEV